MPDVGGVNGEHLRSFIERIEHLDSEISALNDDKKEVYAEAKGTGYDTKIMKQIIRIRRMDKDDLDEQETLLDLYKQALGMLPLFEAVEETEEETGTPVAIARAGRAREATPSVEKMAATIASEAASGNPEAQAIVAAAKVGTDVMLGTARAIVESRKAEPVDLHAAYTAGANACARGEAEDSCTLDDPRAREMWGTGYREWAERKRRAAA